MWQICKRALAPAVLAISLASCTTAVRHAEPASGTTAAGVPQEVQVDFEAALASLSAGDDAAAIQQLEAFVQRYPGYAAAYVNLAIVYERQNQPDQALLLLKKAVEADSTAVEALNRLGVMHRRQGKFADAEAYWRQAVAIDPGYANAWYNLGVLCELYKQDFPAALENYRRYQALASGADGDPVVANWIDDLERRVDMPVQAANATEAL